MKNMLTAIFLLIAIPLWSCTNFLIPKGASTTGNSYIFYSNDGAYAPNFPIHFRGIYKHGESTRIVSWGNQKEGFIPNAQVEYHTIGYHINEYNVSIGESTFGGREELHNRDSFLEYWHLMELGLKRSKSARQMIKVISDLVEEYGYGSEGESFSIADPNEVWIMEIIGKGKGRKGAVWVAMKIPDNCVSVHANHSRIGAFDLKDSKNVMYSKDVISFAIEMGYYDAKSTKAFSFSDAYDPVDPAKLRYTEMRVWDFFRRVAPSANFDVRYARGEQGFERYPLWVKPDKKLSLEDIISLSRSHYDGTDFDMTQGLKGGPFGSPHMSRPLAFEVDGKKANWERPISTPLTAYAFIAELKNSKSPSTLWLGLDNTYTNIYLPIPANSVEIHKSFNIVDYNNFSWESMWWVFNFVSNYSNIRYNEMIVDIKTAQSNLQTEIIKQYRSLENKNKGDYYEQNLNHKSIDLSEQCIENWRELAYQLIVKYNDGLIRDQNLNPTQKGYSQEFYRKAVEDDQKRLLPVWDENSITVEPTNY